MLIILFQIFSLSVLRIHNDKDVRSYTVSPYQLEVKCDGDNSIVYGECDAAAGTTVLLYVNGVLSNSTILADGKFEFKPVGVTLFSDDEVCVTARSIGKLESEKKCK